uniref:CSON001964 protein n=1 Tax=Culicoides sonorensis TaxID=179676 RepID=A0A336MHY4_CULSO
MSYNNFKLALNDLFNKQKNCDVTFTCFADSSSEAQKKTIEAHKLILSMASDVFDAMFYGEIAKSEGMKESIVKIEDIQFSTFKLFLSFIYKKTIEFETPEIAAEFYYTAHKYNSKDALKFIKDFMLKELNPQNATIFYDIAYLYEDFELKEACIKVFTENTFDVITSPKFMSAQPKTVETIFKSEILNINSEMDLIYALERYIQHNKEVDSGICDKMRPALNCIRFLTLVPKDITRTNLLTSDQVKDIIESIPPDGDLSKMPLMLSVNCNKRGKNIAVDNVKMFRELSEVFWSKSCYACVSKGEAYSNHPVWMCSELNDDFRENVTKIYLKYNHVWLMEYELSDVKTIYDLFKGAGIFLSHI